MKRLFPILMILALLAPQVCFALTYEDLNSVKEPAYRVGASDDVEVKYEITKKPEVQSAKKLEAGIESLTYADLSIKKISKEVSQDLELDYDEMMSDLSLLWQGAATKSDTVKFVLYKLSNPDADKPDDKSVKKVIQTIASMSTLIGAGMGNPLLASGAFIGGNLLGIMSQDDKVFNYKFTKVNDADMIILVRKVEDLQQNVVNLYYDYVTTRELFKMTGKMVKQREQNFRLTQQSSKEIMIITDAYYRSSIDMQMKARSDFYAKRASLEQLVGNETFKQFEATINSRDNKDEQ